MSKWFSMWYEDVKEIITNPVQFFSKMKTKGGYEEPVKFAALNYAIGGLIIGILVMLGLGTRHLQFYSQMGIEGPVALIAFPLINIISGIIFLFLGSGIAHLGLTWLGGKGKYEGTFRTVSAISSFNVLSFLSIIPLVNFAYGLYVLYVNVLGQSRVHKLSKWRALAGIILIPVMLIVIATFIGLIAGFSGFLL